MKLQSEDVLGEIVSDFNTRFRNWQRTFSAGANFGFQYNKEDGLKEIYATEVKAVDGDRPTSEGDPRVRVVEERFTRLVGSQISRAESTDANQAQGSSADGNPGGDR